MNYNEKLESLAKELDATVNHAVEVMEEYIATAIEQEVMNAIDELNDFEQMLLLFSLIEEMKQEAKQEEEEIVKAFEKARQDLQPKPQHRQEKIEEEEIVKAFEKARQDLQPKPQPKQEKIDEEEIVKAFIQAFQDLQSKL